MHERCYILPLFFLFKRHPWRSLFLLFYVLLYYSFADRTTTHTSSNSSIDTSLIRDIYCGPEVLFETCIAIKIVDDDDDDDNDDDDDDIARQVLQ